MSQWNEQHLELSPNDQRLLDALVECGFDREAIEPLTPAERQRVDAILGLVGMLKDYPVEDCDSTLIHATMARIDRFEDERTQRMDLTVKMEQSGAGESRGFRIRMPDFITVAAVVLIAVGVFWPVLHSMRNKSIDMTCANNLRMVGFGLSQYAADYNGAMPMATAGIGGSWDSVKNMLNLRPLLDGGYCEHGCLNCPGHHPEQGASYSYRMQSPDAPVGWDTGRVTVALGDANPLIVGFISGQEVSPFSVSLNHGGRGQWVLTNDAATLWLVQPVIGQADNIWLPNGAKGLKPGLRPSDAMDVFLAQ